MKANRYVIYVGIVASVIVFLITIGRYYFVTTEPSLGNFFDQYGLNLLVFSVAILIPSAVGYLNEKTQKYKTLSEWQISTYHLLLSIKQILSTLNHTNNLQTLKWNKNLSWEFDLLTIRADSILSIPSTIRKDEFATFVGKSEQKTFREIVTHDLPVQGCCLHVWQMKNAYLAFLQSRRNMDQDRLISDWEHFVFTLGQVTEVVDRTVTMMQNDIVTIQRLKNVKDAQIQEDFNYIQREVLQKHPVRIIPMEGDRNRFEELKKQTLEKPQSGDYQATIAAIVELLTVYPNEISDLEKRDLYLRLGIYYFELKDYTSCVTMLNQVGGLNSKNIFVLKPLAMSYAELGNWEFSVKAWERYFNSIQNSPIEDLQCVAFAYRKVKNYRRAAEVYFEIFSQDGTNVQAGFSAVEFFIISNQLLKARELLDRLVLLESQSFQVLYLEELLRLVMSQNAGDGVISLNRIAQVMNGQIDTGKWNFADIRTLLNREESYLTNLQMNNIRVFISRLENK